MSKSSRVLSGARALRTGQPSITTGSLALGGALLFGGTAYFSYRYAKAHVALRDEEASVGHASSFRVFDKIADKYDEAIGQEEAALWYGMMRRWLLREAKGEVLEVSVGTGRNFQYYNLDNRDIKSLTFTDLSPQMLLRAEDKFFDELHLGHKHPHVRTKFCLADAHCLVDSSSGNAPPKASNEDGTWETAGTRERPTWWTYWRRRRPEPAEPGSSGVVASEAVEVSGSVTEDARDARDSEVLEPELKEMPGLHARGLLNFFRILMPPSTEPEPAASAPGGDASEHPVTTSNRPTVESRRMSSVVQGPSHEGCSCGDASRACSYAQRCTSGKLESGAQLHRFAPGQFDTVVDTFGLCSHEDPVQ
ncbi:hypothetical protein VOLCADRAFT_94211, partial [Volvox carteri f. nagariensis]